MTSIETNAKRGRPRTLDPVQALDIAMKSYWDSGVEGVSLNEICRRAGVSKPGIYREFGNEDGLTHAALSLYFERILCPLLELAESELSLHEKLDRIVSVMTANRDELGLPHGCLLLKMAHAASRVGSKTREQIEDIQQQMLGTYETMIKRAQANGELKKNIQPGFAASYINAQLSNAMSLQARGEDDKLIREILEMAFSCFD